MEQQFCNEKGLPHSFFLGAEQLRWTPADRAKAVAFEMEKGQRCQLCGTAPWEWDPAQGGSRTAYEVVEHFCHGCYQREYMQEGTKNAPGVRLELARTGTIESAKRQLKAMQRAAREAREARQARADRGPRRARR